MVYRQRGVWSLEFVGVLKKCNAVCDHNFNLNEIKVLCKNCRSVTKGVMDVTLAMLHEERMLS